MSDAISACRVWCRIKFKGGGIVSNTWGSALRGGFGTTLRELACSLRRSDCSGCPLNSICAYGYLFETPINPDAVVMRKYPSAPHPFIFEPPADSTKAVSAGASASLSFVLIGRAIDYLPYFFLTLQEFGNNGLGYDRVPFELEAMASDTGNVIFNRQQGNTMARAEPVRLPLKPGRSKFTSFTLRFETPARVKVDGRIARELTLKDIVANLRRRLFLLSQFHSREPVEELDAAYLDAADKADTVRDELRWVDDSRHSTRQKQEIPIGGLVGAIVFQADYGLLQPLLKAGEYVHVGKNATFGLGRYQLTEGEET